jgi:hypothetical protein
MPSLRPYQVGRHLAGPVGPRLLTQAYRSWRDCEWRRHGSIACSEDAAFIYPNNLWLLAALSTPTEQGISLKYLGAFTYVMACRARDLPLPRPLGRTGGNDATKGRALASRAPPYHC